MRFCKDLGPQALGFCERADALLDPSGQAEHKRALPLHLAVLPLSTLDTRRAGHQPLLSYVVIKQRRLNCYIRLIIDRRGGVFSPNLKLFRPNKL